MGFRFRRRIKLLPGVHLNVGKTGVSTSIGRRGASVTLGKRGTSANVGLPGTGLSYTTKLGGAKGRRKTTPTTPAPTGGSWKRAVAFVLIGLLLLALASS